MKFTSQIIGWDLSLMRLSFKLINTKTKKIHFQTFLKTKTENPQLSSYQMAALNKFPNLSIFKLLAKLLREKKINSYRQKSKDKINAIVIGQGHKRKGVQITLL